MEAETEPRVLVVGMGALGRVYSGCLAGQVDVRGLARTRDQAERINSRGFVLRRAGADEVVMIGCHPQPEDGWRAGLGILLTKSNQSATAAAAAAPLLAAEAPLVTLQNGLGNREAIAAVLGEQRAGWGVSYVAGTAVDKDVAELINPGETIFGRTKTGQAVLGAVVLALNAGGLPARISDEAEVLAWRKVVMAGAMNVAGALSGVEVGRYWADPDWRRFVTAMVEEASSVAVAEGVDVDAAAIISGVAAIAQRAPRTAPSMLQDVRRQRPTEVESMTGELVRHADDHGLAAPTLRGALERVRRLQASWS